MRNILIYKSVMALFLQILGYGILIWSVSWQAAIAVLAIHWSIDLIIEVKLENMKR